MNHLLGMLEPETICACLDEVKVTVNKLAIPLSPHTVVSIVRDHLNHAVKAERAAAKRKPKEA